MRFVNNFELLIYLMKIILKMKLLVKVANLSQGQMQKIAIIRS